MHGIDVRAVHAGETEANLVKLKQKYWGRADLIYAMMVAESPAENLPEMATFTYCPDELNGGQRTLDQILAYRLQIQQQRELSLRRVDRTDPMQRGLDFADMCAGAVFEAYERGDRRYMDILAPYITIKEFNNARPADQERQAGIQAPVVDVAATFIKSA